MPTNLWIENIRSKLGQEMEIAGCFFVRWEGTAYIAEQMRGAKDAPMLLLHDGRRIYQYLQEKGASPWGGGAYLYIQPGKLVGVVQAGADGWEIAAIKKCIVEMEISLDD